MEFPPQPWPTGLVEQAEPLVARVLAPNPSPFTYTGTQTWLVGTEDLAVIDPGPADPAHLAALTSAVAGRRVVAIMCTHTHRDHSPAAAPLAKATGAPIIGCAPLVLTDDGPRLDAAFDTTYASGPGAGWTARPFRAPGWTLTAVATPGHTSNHLCYALEESGALFTGDHVMGWATSVVVPPDGDMGDYLASLALLYDRKDRVYYPAHGPAVDKPRQLVRGMIGHRRARERQIARLLEAQTLAIADMVPIMYKGVDERLWPAAGMSVLAHLIDMERRGQVTRSGDNWSIA